MQSPKIVLKNKLYRVRLIHLHLPTVKYRCLQDYTVEVLKITHNIYDAGVSPHLNVLYEESYCNVINTDFLHMRSYDY